MLPWWAVSFKSRSAKLFCDTSAYLKTSSSPLLVWIFYANQTSVKINDRLGSKDILLMFYVDTRTV